ncbi:MAG: hypothetical protein QM632_06530 [Micrococcaceae bacterium]
MNKKNEDIQDEDEFHELWADYADYDDQLWEDYDELEAYNLTATCSCVAAPEQYDVLDENQKEVGYLRLRHGRFTAQACEEGEDYGKHIVYFHDLNDDSAFFYKDSDREKYTNLGLKALREYLDNPKESYPTWDEWYEKDNEHHPSVDFPDLYRNSQNPLN